MPPQSCVAFQGARRIASGPIDDVVHQVRQQVQEPGGFASILIFDDATGEVVDLDFSGPEPQAEPRRPGRPKLGVIPREVTLLPRHWEWLNAQPGGASVALRKLVEQARRTNEANDRIRQSREAAYRFMSAIAGNEPHFEESLRALFAADRSRFDELIEAWPTDVRDHSRKLAEASFHA
jgi:uncharacterized protein